MGQAKKRGTYEDRRQQSITATEADRPEQQYAVTAIQRRRLRGMGGIGLMTLAILASTPLMGKLGSPIPGRRNPNPKHRF